MPQLTHDQTFRKNGIPELMSPEGFDLAWSQYQAMMVDKLNLLTGGMCTIGVLLLPPEIYILLLLCVLLPARLISCFYESTDTTVLHRYSG